MQGIALALNALSSSRSAEFEAKIVQSLCLIPAGVTATSGPMTYRMTGVVQSRVQSRVQTGPHPCGETDSEGGGSQMAVNPAAAMSGTCCLMVLYQLCPRCDSQLKPCSMIS